MFVGATAVKLVLSFRTLIEAPFAGAAVKVILLFALLPSLPNVNDLPVPGSCLTLLIKTSNEFSPAETTSLAKSNVVVLPSPVKLSFVGAEV